MHRGQRAVFWALMLLAAPAEAEEAQKHHLFNPTPREEMRELSTDRPNQTESPNTVPAGHLLLELDVVSYTRRPVDPTGSREWELAVIPSNIRLGLLEELELQLLVDPLLYTRVLDVGGTERETFSTGGVTVRTKLNLWGNDGGTGTTAFALLPFVTLPFTLQGERVPTQAGLVLPFSIELPNEFSVGLQLGADAAREDFMTPYMLELIASASVSRDLIGTLGAYLEVFTRTRASTGELEAQLDGGFTLGVTDDVQLDIGAELPVTPDTEGVAFLGLSVRL